MKEIVKPSGVQYMSTPLGFLKIIAVDGYLAEIQFVENPTEIEQKNEISESVILQLQEYFDGKRQEFDLPLKPFGTDFQKEVWKELLKIEFGQLSNYKSIAISLGDPNKNRAVGNANGANPIPIIIPCHRVIGSNNNMIGYSGGIDKKRWLIEHENAGLGGSLFG